MGLKLTGVIYMHRISDFKVGGASRQNLNLFRALCGDDALSNVIVITNMWGEVSVDLGEERERELQTDNQLFKAVLDKGALMLRHDNTLATAQSIVRRLVDKQPKALRIQCELVDEGRDITETTAGLELDKGLAAAHKKHTEELAEIQKEKEAALARKDEETTQELEAARRGLLKHIEEIESDRARLSQEFAAEKARTDERICRGSRNSLSGRREWHYFSKPPSCLFRFSCTYVFPSVPCVLRLVNFSVIRVVYPLGPYATAPSYNVSAY